MKEEYVTETKIRELTEIEKEEELIFNIIRTKKELECARRNFEFAYTSDLVDYYIYQIKANQSKLDYLIKLAKTKGIFVNSINQAEIQVENRAG